MTRPLWTSLAALVAATALTATLAGPAQAAPPPKSAAKVVAAMQPGWNLGNTFDAVGADETAWGNPRVTKKLLSQVEKQGFKSVRIPVTLGQHEGPAPDYTIDPVVLDRVEEVVDWALDEDLSVLLDLHHDSWMWTNAMPTRHDEVLAQFTATWEQLAERFRDHPRTLLFESINEPQFAGSTGEAQEYALLDELNAAFHQVVRSSGGSNADRVLVLPDAAHRLRAGTARLAGPDVHRAERPEPGRDLPLLRLLAVQRERRGRHPVRRDRAAGPHRHVRPGAQHPGRTPASRSSSASTACSGSTGTPARSSRARS